MRSYRLIGLIVVGLVGVGTITAIAHPRKVHYHASACHFAGVASGAGGK